MVNQCVTKLYKQHTTVVSCIHPLVRKQLKVGAGDHLLWQVDEQSNFVQVSKVVFGGVQNEGDSRNSDRKDQGGGA